MKVYNLCCKYEHHFEGWFSSDEDFTFQLSRKLIACPICDHRTIKKLPSAPRLNLSSAQVQREQRGEQYQTQWLEIAKQIVENSEDVGDRFAEETRRIHYKEIPERPIRGVATNEECEALAEEGIEIVQFPIPAALKHPIQ
jgi:hypothetical protein